MRAFLVEPLRKPEHVQQLRQITNRLKYTIEYIFDDGERRPSLFEPAKYVQAVEDALTRKRFDPMRDAFVPSGKSLALTQAAMAFGALFPMTLPSLIVFDATAPEGEEYRLVGEGL
jgi:hypothetical protein